MSNENGPLSGHAFANLLNAYYGHIIKAMDNKLPKEERAYNLQLACASAPLLEIEANRIEHSIVIALERAKKSFGKEQIDHAELRVVKKEDGSHSEEVIYPQKSE